MNAVNFTLQVLKEAESSRTLRGISVSVAVRLTRGGSFTHVN